MIRRLSFQLASSIVINQSPYSDLGDEVIGRFAGASTWVTSRPCLGLLRASILVVMLRRRRVLVAAITGLNTIGLAVVTEAFRPYKLYRRGGQHALDGLVVPAQVPGNRTITLITSRNEPVGALIAGAMQTMAGPLQEEVGAKVDAGS